MAYTCMSCGHDLAWEADYMGSEIGVVDDYGEDDMGGADKDFVVGLYNCPHCGMHYEIHSCPVSEHKNFPAYDEYEGEKA